MKLNNTLVNRDPFSNGTEGEWWMEHNCDICWKYKRCRHYREIVKRMFCDDPIHQDTIDYTQMNDCQKREKHRSRKPIKLHRPIKGQMELQF